MESIGNRATARLLAGALAACFCQTALADTIVVRFVDAGASAGGNGTSWSSAYNSLQTALSSANPSASEIYRLWLKAGTYKPDTSTRGISFQLKNRVEIYGGFAGNEDPATFDLSNRDFAAHETILSGDLSGNDGNVPPTSTTGADNSFHVVTANGVLPTARLDGCTVSHGYANSSAFPGGNDLGAGIKITGANSSPTVIKCTIKLCVATSQGGGIYSNSSGSSPSISNCTFNDNHANSAGGGIYLSSLGSFDITACVFTGNTTRTTTTADPTYGGGAVYIASTSSTGNTRRLLSCNFQSNGCEHEDDGGAVHYSDLSTSAILEVRDCTFAQNYTTDKGEGGAIWASTSGVFSSPVFYGVVYVKCTFLENQSDHAGGGVRGVGNGDHRFVNCSFLGNTASADTGGGISTGGSGNFLEVSNCLYSGNTAPIAGAVYCGGSATHASLLTNSTIAYNDASSNYGGVSFPGGTADPVTIVNCILWGNTDGNGGNSLSKKQLGPQATGNEPTVTYSDVQGGYTYTVTGNIDLDPQFVSVPSANWRLLFCSPAKDAGSNSALTTASDPGDLDTDGTTNEDTPKDLDLHARRAGDPTTPIVDMGAYEFTAAACALLGDMNADSSVNGKDIQGFTAAVVALSTSSPCSDMNNDGITNLSDIPCFVYRLLFGNTCTAVCGQTGLLIFNDCNSNGNDDASDILGGDSKDCNNNGIPDECEIDAESTADGGPFFCTADCDPDVDSDGIPDSCAPDCNTNGIPDAWDISQNSSEDCNSNGIPDECEKDCNTNGVPDDCDIANSTSSDCDSNGVPDECQHDDCNTNGVPDSCDIASSTSLDCNSNGNPDECDLALGSFGSLDCNDNGIPDECDIAACDNDPACGDCNGNHIPDACDIAVHVSADDNENGVPDECDWEQFGMSRAGGDESGEGQDNSAAWEDYYDWAAQQCWGPNCESTGDEQFQAMVEELQSLGLPITGSG